MNEKYQFPMVLYIDTNTNVEDYKFQVLKSELSVMGWTVHTSKYWTWKRNWNTKSNIDIVITKNIKIEHVDVKFLDINEILSDHKPI